jgi:transposase
MNTKYKINEPAPELAKHHKRWAKNRAFIEGEDAVKAQGQEFLPPVRVDDSAAEYDFHKLRTNFYPAAHKIAKGVSGLIFRKKAQLNSSSARIQALSQLISPTGQSLDDLGEELIGETLITNFTGLLVDHPDEAAFVNLSAANAEQLGFFPTMALYRGESILEVRYGFVNFVRAINYVRLLEDDGHRVRELLLNASGIYEVHVHTDDGNFAFDTAPTVSVPKRSGKHLTAIPFQNISDNDKVCPQPSPIVASVDLNLQHYVASGTMAQIVHLTSAPVLTVTGFDPGQDDKGEDKEFTFPMSPGSVISLKDPDIKFDWFIFDPKGASIVENNLKSLKDDLFTIGHSILLPEKPAPESPDTKVIRQAAENAILASLARNIGRKIEKALRDYALWADPSNAELTYVLNTDFLPQQMTPQEHAELRNSWLAGAITHETFLYALRDGEILSAAIDPVAEIAATQAEVADRPTAAR